MENPTEWIYAAMMATADDFNWGKVRSGRRATMFVTVAAATVVAVVALVALVVLRAVSPESSNPRGFDHSIWAAHRGPRQAMLTDLLRHTICPGTTYRRVIALLGKPDSTLLTYPKGAPPSIEYDVGSFGLFYIYFKTGGHGYVVYEVSPPPSAEAWPDTGCWT